MNKDMAGIPAATGPEEEPALLAAPPPPSSPAPALVVRPTGETQAIQRPLATETPVSISYNGLAYAVMMASPIDLEDFVTGFSLTEQVVAGAGEIESVDIRPLTLGVLAQLRIPQERARGLVEHRRTLVGQTGCGLCGIVELEQAVRRYSPLSRPPRLDTEAVFAARAALAPAQPLNAETGAAHAAAFADATGRLLAVREDVGRHNALDKLIGHLARAGIAPESGFVLVTSRISFELVQKCLAVGIPALAGISAPTHLAVELAQTNRLTLIGLARPDGFQLFADPFELWGQGAVGPGLGD